MKRYAITCLMTATLFLFNSCSKNPVTGKRNFVTMSTEQEIAMGQQADPEIVAQFGLYENPAVQRFIQQKGQQMAEISHRNDIKYEFKVLDSPVINAFAVPGGYVYFTRGILAHFNNEAQFAGVLGHEIGHVAARHTVQSQSKSVLAQVGLVVGSVISPEFAQFGEALSQGVGLLFLKHGRDAERESDRLGVEYSTKIGYDAAQMADFFLTLQREQEKEGGEAIPGFLSTHPNPGDRYNTVGELAQEWKQKENLTNPQVNRDSYLKMLDGLIYGEDPKQGFVENSIFYHPELKFQFTIPANWQHMNSPQQVQMAPKDGSGIMNLTLAQGQSLEAAGQQMIEQYKLTLVENQSVTVNGLPALAIIAEQQQEQQVIRTLTYLIQYGGNIYSLMGITTAANFNTLAQTFQNSMRSFQQLTDTEKINRQPERIRIVTVPSSTTLSQVLQSNKTPSNRMDELAILNGMQLSDRLEKGTLIKVIRR